MQPSEPVSTNRRPPSAAEQAGRPASRAEQAGDLWELEGLRSVCFHQARLINSLTEAMSLLDTRVSALEAEKADLQAQR